MPSKLIWDDIGEKIFETGLSQGVLYIQEGSVYPKGHAWNGLISITESPGGAEPTDLYADNIKYASLRSAETFGGTIEAYTFPSGFSKCDGGESIAKGVSIGQQGRSPFGLCYKTEIGSDAVAEGGTTHYKLHLIYGATASPSEKAYQSINDSPSAITFSWEFTTTPVPVPAFKPTATIVIDSSLADPTKLKALEDILFGSDSADARLPLPAEVITMMAAG